MIRLFRRHGDADRGERDELVKVLRCLKSSDIQIRSAVGAGVSRANTDFMRQFGGMRSFRQVPPDARERFYSRLSDLEWSLRSRGLGMALGVGLYRIWLSDLLAERRDIAELLGEELTELSRRAASIQPPGRGE
jgi:hypothetical protein